MGKIRVHEFISLDGVYEDPRWTFEYGFDPKMGEDIGELTNVSQGILLGRTTFEMFAPAWSTRTAEQDPGAPFFNDTQKYVVSSTLGDAESVWGNSEVVGPYSADAIRSLKDGLERDLYVSGSGTLVRAMLADGLVDELHMFVYPVALGLGLRLFPDGGAKTKLELVGSGSYPNGVVHLAYEPA